MLNDVPVDIVYTWVNGDDPEWCAKKRRVLSGLRGLTPETIGDCRFRDNNELLYSIRSVAENCPWVNRIFIITDRQVPGWLKSGTDRISVVDHADIFPERSALPTFNSNAIELRLHHIPGLAEHFISFNDDMFVGRPVGKDFFYRGDGTPRLFTTRDYRGRALERIVNPELLVNRNPYQLAICRARAMVRDQTGVQVKNMPRHCAKPLRRSLCRRVEEMYGSDVQATLRNQVRTGEDVWFPGLVMFQAQAEGVPPRLLKVYHNPCLPFLSRFRYRRDYVYVPLNEAPDRCRKKFRIISRCRPALFCINDYEDAGEDIRREMVAMLDALFSHASEFEKEG